VKITSYNQHCRPAPFLRTLVESPSPSLLARREPTTLSNQKDGFSRKELAETLPLKMI
jgi:hypothetical protein